MMMMMMMMHSDSVDSLKIATCSTGESVDLVTYSSSKQYTPVDVLRASDWREGIKRRVATCDDSDQLINNLEQAVMPKAANAPLSCIFGLNKPTGQPSMTVRIPHDPFPTSKSSP
jgi:hypothetical protein